MANWWEREADLAPGVADFQRRAAYFQQLIGAQQQALQVQRPAQPRALSAGAGITAPGTPAPTPTAEPRASAWRAPNFLEYWQQRRLPSLQQRGEPQPARPKPRAAEPGYILPPGVEQPALESTESIGEQHERLGWDLIRRLFPWMQVSEDQPKLVQFLGTSTARGLGRVIRAFEKPEERALLGMTPEGTTTLPEGEAGGWLAQLLGAEGLPANEEYLRAVAQKKAELPKLLKGVEIGGQYYSFDPLGLGDNLARLQVNFSIATKGWEAVTQASPAARKLEQVAAIPWQMLQEPAIGLEELTGAIAILLRPESRNLSVEQWYPLTTRTWSLTYQQLKARLGFGPRELPGWGEDVLGSALLDIASGRADAEKIAAAAETMGAELVGQMLADPLNLLDWVFAANRVRRAQNLTAAQAKMLEAAADSPRAAGALAELERGLVAAGIGDMETLQRYAAKAGVNVDPQTWDKVRDVFTKPWQFTPESRVVRDLNEMAIVLTPALEVAESGEDALRLLTMWAEDPASLAPLFGRVPTSLPGRKTSTILKVLAEHLEDLPSIQAKPFNPVRVWVDIDQMAHEVLRVAYGYEDPGRIQQFFLAYKRLMSEFYLSATSSPGYVVRNTFGDSMAMATDGLLTFEDSFSIDRYMEQFGEFTTRRLMTEGFAGREALMGEGAIKSMLPGALGKISEAGQRFTRFAEPLRRIPLGEESRYKRAVYMALKRFWTENAPNFLPELPDIARAQLGEGAEHLHLRIAHEASLKARRQALDEFLEGVKGKQIEPTRYVDPEDLDAMSPTVVKQVRDELGKLGNEAPVEEVDRVIDEVLARVDEDEARRLSEMEDLPARVHVTTDVDEAETVDGLIDEMEEVVARTGREDLAREVEEMKRRVPEVERELDTARGTAIEGLLDEPTEDGLEILMRANADAEDMRNDWRRLADRLRNEAKAAYDADPRLADEIWTDYFRKMQEGWSDLAAQRIARFQDAGEQLARLRRGEGLEDILGATARQKRAEEWLLKASEVPERPKGYLPGRVLRSDEDDKFQAFINWRRGRLDSHRTNAWRAVYGTEPEDYGKVLDLLDSADRDIEQFGKATAGKIRELYRKAKAEAEKAMRMHKSRTARARAVDAVWEKYYILRNDTWTQFWDAGEQRWKIAERDVLWGNWSRGARMEPPVATPKPPPDRTPPPSKAGAAAVIEGDEEIVKKAIAKADADWSDVERKAIQRWTKQGREMPDLEPSILPKAADLPPYTRDQFMEDLKGVANLTDEEATTIGQLTDAVAGTWSKRSGRPPEEWYTKYLAGFHRGDQPGFELFQRAPGEGTPQFGAWFKTSKAVDAAGNPLPLYHGSPAAGYEWFDTAKLDPDALYGPGIYTTDAADVAGGYAGQGVIPELVTRDPQTLKERIWDAVVEAEHPEVRKAREEVDRLADEWDKVNAQQGRSLDAPAKQQELARIEREHDMANTRLRAKEIMYGESGVNVNWDMLIDMGRREPEPYHLHQALRRYGVPMEGIIDYPGAPGVYPVYMSIQRPFDIDGAFTADEFQKITGRPPAWTTKTYSGDEVYSTLVNRGYHNPQGVPAKQWANEYLASQGYDGIKHTGGLRSGGKTHQVYIAFEPEQVKSIWNQGDWSRNRHLLYQGSGMAPRWWYKAERVVDAKMPNRASVEQVRNILTKGGVKQDELQWSGVLRWLDNQEGMLTKDDVLGYLQANRVEVREVHAGGDPAKLRADRWSELEGKLQERGYRVEWEPTGGPDDDYRPAYIVGPEGDEWYSNQLGELYPDDAQAAITAQEMFDIEGTDWTQRTQYGTYTLPGGENYQELRLTLPETSAPGSARARWDKDAQELLELDMLEHPTGAQIDRRWQLRERGAAGRPGPQARTVTYRSTHWPEENVVAHVRVTDRTGPSGERVLFLEEIQSDWHQAGREKGYKVAGTENEIKRLQAERLRLVDEGDEMRRKLGYYFGSELHDRHAALMQQVERIDDQLRKLEGTVPPAPFAGTWDELCLKRMYRWAAENDYDAIAWTTGAQQADRYNLAKLVDELSYNPKNSMLYGVKDGEVLVHRTVERSELPEVIGKDATQRLLAVEPSPGGHLVLKGDDLQVGAHGMTTFYDRILPYSSNKLTKRWGVEVGEMELNLSGAAGGEAARVRGQFADVGPFTQRNFPQVHGFTLPDYMKRDLLDEGLPLFQEGARGGLQGQAERILGGLAPDARLPEEAIVDLAKACREEFDAGRLTREQWSELNQRLYKRPGRPAATVGEIQEIIRSQVPRAGGGAKGAVDFLEDGRGLIRFFEGSDFSTAVHEIGHVIRRTLPERDLRIVEEWAGLAGGDFERMYSAAKEHRYLESLGQRTAQQEGRLEKLAPIAKRYEAAEEKWARGFERYLAEGRAPAPELQSIFERAKQWLIDIYHKIVGSDIDVDLNDNIRGVMDRLLVENPLPRTNFSDGIVGGVTKGWADPTRKYEFRYRLVNMDDVVASHTQGLDPSPGYPEWLQPRMRSRADSASQIDHIARHLDPEELVSRATNLDSGPIITGPDGLVESGNGRYLAIQRAQASFPEKYSGYVDYLREHLEAFGLKIEDLEGVENPILVRERVSDVDRAAFVKEANEARSMRMGAVETAAADVGRVSDRMIAALDVTETESIDSALKAKKNRDIIKAFMKALPAEEAAALRTAKGELAQAGLQRIKAALLASTFQGDAGVRLVTAMTESVAPVVKNVENAIYGSLAQLGRAEAAMRSGARAADLSIADDVAAAVDVLARVKREGLKVEDYLKQSRMFRELTPEQLALFKFFEENKYSTKKIREFLQAYAAEVMEHQAPVGQGTLIGGMQVRANRAELISVVGKKLGFETLIVEGGAAPPFTLAQRKGQQMGMFTQGEDLPLFSGTAQRAEGARFAPPEAAAEPMLPGFEPTMGDREKYAAKWAEGAPPPRPKLEKTPEGYYVTNAEGLGGRSFTDKKQAQAYFEQQAKAWDEAQGAPPPISEELRPQRVPKGQATLWQAPQQTGFWRLDPDGWRDHVAAINQPGATPGPLPHDILQRSTEATRRGLEKMREGIKGDWNQWQPQFASQEARGALDDWFTNDVTPNWFENRAVAYDYATTQADFALLDYSRRRNLDVWMAYVFPYHYWFTRAGKNWAKRLAKRPGMLASYLRARDAMKLANENAGRRQRFESKIRVPFPWLPPWMGDAFYVDPLRMVLPFADLWGTNWDDADDSKQGLRKIYDTARNFGLRPYHIWEYLYQQGIFQKAGELAGMAPGPAERMLGPEYKGNFSYMLPQTGLIKGLTSIAHEAGVEAMPPGGINIEAPLRRAIGLPAGEVFDPYRTNRMLANLAAERPKDMQLTLAVLRAQALVEADEDKQTGKVWDPSSEMAQQVATEQGWTPEQLAEAQQVLAEAIQKAALERSVGTLGWLTGPQMAVEPTGERAQLEMAEQARGQTWSPAQPEGSRAAYEQFKRDYPAMYPRSTQYNVLPGDKAYEAMPPGARANWLILRQQKEQLHEEYDQAVDDLLRMEPWNWTSRNALETQRRAALAELDEALPLPDYEGEMPAILYGMNPDEMWNSTAEKELYRWTAAKPDPSRFETEEGVDWSAYYKEENKWRASLPRVFSFGIPQGGMYARMDPAEAMRQFEQRYDSPLEAAYRIYQQDIAAPAWDAYNQAKQEREQMWPGLAELEDQYFQLDQNSRRAHIKTHPQLKDYWDWKDQQGSLYEQTVGRVGPVPAEALIPGILARYKTRGWTEEVLKQELAGVTFPGLAQQQDLKRGGTAQATAATGAGGATQATTYQRPQYTPAELEYMKRKILEQWAGKQGRWSSRGTGRKYTSGTGSKASSSRYPGTYYPRWLPPNVIRGGPFRY